VRELGRSPPVDSNELFDKKGKRADDAPAEGSKSKEPQQKHKRGKKGKKPHRETRAQGTMTTETRPSQSTRPERALELPLKTPACSTTC
jgi:hypothetical protein